MHRTCCCNSNGVHCEGGDLKRECPMRIELGISSWGLGAWCGVRSLQGLQCCIHCFQLRGVGACPRGLGSMFLPARRNEDPGSGGQPGIRAIATSSAGTAGSSTPIFDIHACNSSRSSPSSRCTLQLCLCCPSRFYPTRTTPRPLVQSNDCLQRVFSFAF